MKAVSKEAGLKFFGTTNAHGIERYGSHRFVAFMSIPFYELLLRESEKIKIELKSLILAQIERWRHALHMQVER